MSGSTPGSPIWHPFTQHAIFPEMRRIAAGQGAWLTAADGARIFDAISSWWVVTHGHCHPRIIAAIRDQAERLDQVIFAGYTHEPAERFTEKLLEILPGDLTRAFFSDSGSTAVEVALKMALGFWRHAGDGRSGVVVMENGYHGDTVGTMSAGERGVFSQPYEPLMFGVHRLPFPRPGQEQATLDALERHCATGRMAAFLVEPLVLGAGGMLMYPPALLAEMAAICARHRVLLIADEVMTGWGRTGTFLACEQAGVVPDILCLSKGITGGSLPLAVTVCKEPVYEAHWSEDRARTFFHSSSYTANPIACAAAAANLDIWRDEPVLERVAAVGDMQAEGARRLSGAAGLSGVRRQGTILACEIEGRGAGYMSALGPDLLRFFADRDLLIRPLGSTVYLMPPYCSTGDELARCHDAIIEAADAFG
ncbi:MAG: adenosylmethionine--8-amino-7-oxononanoate transaminase [Proteobacteria bacterium]|nr:adenosylmethionine--8-amino-7-oxononanoate transaminase [Pseudomonadota bacterium]MBS0574433.1 adenosylmethionine--8-amino-7-oxononanoate transaminase [Pseudomonadota bacterium]